MARKRRPTEPSRRNAPVVSRRSFRFRLELLEDRLAPATFTVNSTLDLRDDNPGDGVARAIDPATGAAVVTLRAAVMEANANDPLVGPDEITLPTGTYALTQSTARLNTLPITSELTIRSTGSARDTFIDAGGLGSVFEIAGFFPVPASPLNPHVEIAGVTIRNGSSRWGAGINVVPGLAGKTNRLLLTNSALENNTATNEGGALFIGDGTVTISGCTLSGNSAGLSGGGLFNHSQNVTGIDPATGQTVVKEVALRVLNSSFSGNTAGRGGGLFNGRSFEFPPRGPGTAELVNVTVGWNTATAAGGGGGLSGNGAGQFRLINTIVASNLILAGGTATNCSLDLIDPVTSFNLLIDRTSHHNLEDANDCRLDPALNNRINTNPLLAFTLADNGGPTRTLALPGNSLAVNAGDNAAAAVAGLTTDQRGPGFPRLVGTAADLGAFEVQTIVPNHPPTAQDDRFVIGPDVQGWRLYVTLNDSDPDGEAFSIVSFTNGNYGTVRDSASEPGVLFYTPTPGTPRTDQFTYTLRDAHGATATANVFITKNQKPWGDGRGYRRAHGSTGAFTIAAPGLWENTRDPDGDPLTLRLAQSPQYGTVTLGRDASGRPDGSFTYTPTTPGGQMRNDSFSYVLNDGFEDSDPIGVGIDVPNSAPVVADDFALFFHGQPSPVFFALDYTDADGDRAVSATVVGQTFYGDVSLNVSGGLVVMAYIPRAGQLRGSDTFSFRVNDGYADSNVATFEIRAPNFVPVARSVGTGDELPNHGHFDHALLGPNGSSTVRGNLLGTAQSGPTGLGTDGDGDSLTAFLDGNPLTMEDSRPKHGTITLAPNGDFAYTPDAGYEVWGTDRFGYRFWDGHDASNLAYVTIRQSLGKVAVGSDSFSVRRGGEVRMHTSALVSNDHFESGLPIAWFVQSLAIPEQVYPTTGPQGDYLTVASTGARLGSAPPVPVVAFGDALIFHSTESDILGPYARFAYRLRYPAPGLDPNRLEESDTVYVFFDITRTAEADSDGVDDDTERTVRNAHGDANGDGLDDHWTLFGDGNGDGIPDYLQANVASPSIDVFEHVTLVSGGDTSLFNVRTLPNPSANDSPPYEFPLGFFSFWVTGVRPGGATTVTIYPPDNVVIDTYWKYGTERQDNHSTPFDDRTTDHWYEFLYDSATGTGAEIINGDDLSVDTDRIVLHFVDGQRGDMDVVDSNDPGLGLAATTGVIRDPGGPAIRALPPVAVGDSYVIDEDRALGVAIAGVLANDTGRAGAPLTAALVRGPDHGTLTLRADGSFTYIPAANFGGTDSFTYKATDRGLTSDAAVVTITVNPVNDAPVARIEGPAAGVRGQTRAFTLRATDPDAGDLAAGFTFRIDWDGNGTVDQTVTGPDGTAVGHAFPAAGTFMVRVIAADRHGATGPAVTLVVGITAVAQQPDPLAPGRTMLVVGGTTGADAISIDRTGSSGALKVQFLGAAPVSAGPPSGGFSRVVVFGQAGNDAIGVSGDVLVPAWLYGGDGFDALLGGGGPNVLLGGDGSDALSGRDGRDVLIGGAAADALNGGAGDDLLIAGATTYDADESALAALQAEWLSSRTYANRLANLRNVSNPTFGSRLNGNFFLRTGATGRTVFDDGAPDVLAGGSGLDAYFVLLNSSTRDVVLLPDRDEQLIDLG